MEMYFVQPTTLSKYFRAILGCGDVNIESLLLNYSAVLRELYLVRTASEALGLKLDWINFRNSCTVDGETISLNQTEFIRNILNHSQKWGQRELLMAKIDELRPAIDADIRNHSNGHDFVHLLLLSHGREAKNSGLPNAEAVSSALRGCAEIDQLDRQELFVRLGKFAAA